MGNQTRQKQIRFIVFLDTWKYLNIVFVGQFSVEFLAVIPLPFDIPDLYGVLLLFLLLIIGIVIIILIAKVLLFILPAGIIALVVWFLTGSLFWQVWLSWW